MLVRAAHSANIKERRDASTALFDAQGQMVMQAEHIPVHLGAMPDAVAAVLDSDQRRGRHLDPERPLPRRHAPARHHAGLAAVSSPAGTIGFAATPRASRRRGRRGPGQHAGPLDGASTQEGVVIPPTLLARGREIDARAAGRAGRAGCADPRQRAADLRAQLAANRLAGAAGRRARRAPRRRRAPAGDGGGARLRRAPHARARSPRCRTAATRRGHPRGRRRRRPARSADRCRGAHRGRRGSRSTSPGTDPQSDGNLNCPLSVTKSAVYYVVRVLTDPDIPPSAGAYRPVQRDARRPAAW